MRVYEYRSLDQQGYAGEKEKHVSDFHKKLLAHFRIQLAAEKHTRQQEGNGDQLDFQQVQGPEPGADVVEMVARKAVLSVIFLVR